jgi:hypothetical protein
MTRERSTDGQRGDIDAHLVEVAEEKPQKLAIFLLLSGAVEPHL